MPVFVRTEGIRASSHKVRALRLRARRMLRALGLERTELSILLCGDATIRALNRTYRKKDRPTDVLSFGVASVRGQASERLLGDIVISLETARRQAVAKGPRRSTILTEATELLAHGLLHLLGYDHRTRAEERRMKARGDLLLSAAMARSR